MDNKPSYTIKPFYTVQDLMQIFGISRPTAYKWCKYNFIEYSRVGWNNEYRFTQAAVDKVMEDNKNKKIPSKQQ